MSKEKLEQFKTETRGHINRLTAEIANLEEEIMNAESKLEYNVYKDHDEAEDYIRERHRRYANEACEGSYNYGEDEYDQEYMIEGSLTVYVGTSSFEYNRHDKTYYYVDGSDYSYKEKLHAE